MRKCIHMEIDKVQLKWKSDTLNGSFVPSHLRNLMPMHTPIDDHFRVSVFTFSKIYDYYLHLFELVFKCWYVCLWFPGITIIIYYFNKQINGYLSFSIILGGT